MPTYGQFSDSYVPIMDGVGVMVQNYARCLHAAGHRPVVVAPRAPKYRDKDPFEVVRVQSILLPPKKPYRLQLPALSYQARRQLESIPFDLVHAHSPFASGSEALRLGHQQGIPVITTFHSKYKDDFLQVAHSEQIAQIALKLIMRFYDKVDAVWTVNQGTLGTLREYGYQGRVDVVPNGCDLVGKGVSRTEAQELVQARWGVPKELPLLLFVGQMAAVKNPMLVLKAAAQILRGGIDLRLMMVGEGKLSSELKALAQSLGIGDKVIFTGVLKQREVLPAIYARASLFVFPSRYDNAPLVVREAAALGCPALLLEGTNSAEGVVHGENGFLAQDDSLAPFAHALQEALRDPLGLMSVGENARQTIALSWERVVAEVTDRYSEIICEYKRRPTKQRRAFRARH